MSDNGQVIGLAGGASFNLTQNNFVYPDAVSGAAFYREQDGMNQVVTVLDSGGTPRDNARFGDYLDAVLIRAADRRDLGGVTDPSVPAEPVRPRPPVPPDDDEVTTIRNLRGDVLAKVKSDD